MEKQIAAIDLVHDNETSQELKNKVLEIKIMIFYGEKVLHNDGQLYQSHMIAIIYVMKNALKERSIHMFEYNDLTVGDLSQFPNLEKVEINIDNDKIRCEFSTAKNYCTNNHIDFIINKN